MTAEKERPNRLTKPRRLHVPAPLRVLLITISLALDAHAQKLPHQHQADAKNGERIYKGGCIACHGADGKGAPEAQTEFKRPDTFPDFTDCHGTTAEANSTWKATIVHGGKTRALSQIMPAFGDLLSSAEIDDAMAYLRHFCPNKHWARGELNLPRALITEKAFPEDEFVVSSAFNASGAPGSTTDFIHEERFGVRNQLEVDVPVSFRDVNHQWHKGFGDTTIAVKREMFSSLRTGSIFSLQAGLLAPTGDSKQGFGRGTTTFEPFLAYDQLFPTNTFVQFQMGADLPHNTGVAPQSLFYRAAFGQAIGQDRMLGRLWTPMVELVADHDLIDGAKTNWDAVPQMQVTISRRQHIRADVGYRAPVTNTAGRTPQLTFYVLWDWADGKLWEGWR